MKTLLAQRVLGSLKVRSNLPGSMLVLLLRRPRLPVFLFFFLFELFEMLISSPSPPDPSSNYIRQLETKVRILEDDNNKLLSQVSPAHE